jgi:hypothetical protein
MPNALYFEFVISIPSHPQLAAICNFCPFPVQMVLDLTERASEPGVLPSGIPDY